MSTVRVNLRYKWLLRYIGHHMSVAYAFTLFTGLGRFCLQTGVWPWKCSHAWLLWPRGLIITHKKKPFLSQVLHVMILAMHNFSLSYASVISAHFLDYAIVISLKSIIIIVNNETENLDKCKSITCKSTWAHVREQSNLLQEIIREYHDLVIKAPSWWSVVLQASVR